MRVGASGVLSVRAAWLRQGLRTPKSRLEGGGRNWESRIWHGNVWASKVTELGAATQNLEYLKRTRALGLLIGMCDL